MDESTPPPGAGQTERNMEIDVYRWELTFLGVKDPMELALETLEMIALRCEDMATFAEHPEGYRDTGVLRASARRVRAATERIRELNSAPPVPPREVTEEHSRWAIDFLVDIINDPEEERVVTSAQARGLQFAFLAAIEAALERGDD